MAETVSLLKRNAGLRVENISNEVIACRDDEATFHEGFDSISDSDTGEFDNTIDAGKWQKVISTSALHQTENVIPEEEETLDYEINFEQRDYLEKETGRTVQSGETSRSTLEKISSQAFGSSLERRGPLKSCLKKRSITQRDNFFEAKHVSLSRTGILVESSDSCEYIPSEFLIKHESSIEDVSRTESSMFQPRQSRNDLQLAKKNRQLKELFVNRRMKYRGKRITLNSRGKEFQRKNLLDEQRMRKDRKSGVRNFPSIERSLQDERPSEIDQQDTRQNILNGLTMKNKKLLDSLKEIIDSMESDSQMNLKLQENRKTSRTPFTMQTSTHEFARFKKDPLRMMKPVFENPSIEKTLDESMSRALKRYMARSDEWEHLANSTTTQEPPNKRKKN